jgi:hypothetical protein
VAVRELFMTDEKVVAYKADGVWDFLCGLGSEGEVCLDALDFDFFS